MSISNEGKHLIADIRCDVGGKEYLTDQNKLYGLMMELAYRSASTILSSHFHAFDGYGWTGVLVLGESHVSVHTWPERGVINLDLFTCSGESLEGCKTYLEWVFGGKNVKCDILSRTIMREKLDKVLDS